MSEPVRNTEELPAVGSPVERGVGRLEPERDYIRAQVAPGFWANVPKRCEHYWGDSLVQTCREYAQMQREAGVFRGQMVVSHKTPNARVQAGTTAPQPDPERDEAARRGASPGTSS